MKQNANVSPPRSPCCAPKFRARATSPSWNLCGTSSSTFFGRRFSRWSARGWPLSLAKTLGAANKLPELATLYQEAFKDVRAAGLGGDEARSRVVSLREGMIRTLTGLGKFEDALDQHIEIINAFPEDDDRLATAMEFSEKHNLTGRLTSYYEKL